VSHWFGSVDMGGAPPTAVAVLAGLERLLQNTQPTLVQPARSWIKARGRGWPPPELVPPPEVPPSPVSDWPDCDIGIRIGHVTEPKVDITIGVGPRDAVVGCMGGRITIPVTSDAWIGEVVSQAANALRARYVWEDHYRGHKLVWSEVAYVGIHIDGTEGRHVHTSFRARRAWLHRSRPPCVERRVITYGLQGEHQ
jgi:hypothetical protein